MTYKLIYLARRAAGVSRADWPRTWRSHAVFASRFPVLEARIDWSRYTNRAELERPGLSQDHDGVCVCAGPALEGLDGSGFSPADRKLIDQDELRVFDRLTPEFSWFCREEIVRDGPLGEAALFRFLPEGAAPGPASEGATRHAINRPVHAPPPLFPFTAIAESWFPGVEEALADFAPGPPASVAMLTEVCHRWPKG